MTFLPIRSAALLSRRLSLKYFISFSVILLSSLVACGPRQQQTSELHVAAAADLIPAFEEIGKEFESAHKTKVVFSFGSTGLLTRQIENGAPMDVFAAASIDFINQLEHQGLILTDTKAVYARGRITLWVPRTASLKIENLTDLTKDEVKRIAIANPDHAPYGLAAQQALQSVGIWEQVESKIVYGDNIRQTLQFAETGNVDVAIVALALSKQSDGQWTLIPAELHNPINQGLAVIKGTRDEKSARDFASFVMGPQGQAILAKYGFEQVK